MTTGTVPILMYHQVAAQPPAVFRKYCVTTSAFKAQMRWLALAGFTTINLDDLLAARTGERQLPPRPVLITFDDGFADCLTQAVPAMWAHGFRATFFLVAGLIGQTSTWLAAERGVSLPLLSWPQARLLEAEGFQCGAHSLTHPRLATLSPDACRVELAASRDRLQEALGHPIRHLAYPHGSFNATVRSIAAECGYQTACSVEIGLSSAQDDLLALRRVPVLGQDSRVDFIFRVRTGHTLRGALARFKQRLSPRPAVAP